MASESATQAAPTQASPHHTWPAKLQWLGLFVVCFLATAIYYLPAKVIESHVKQAANIHQLTIYRIGGRLWQGSAYLKYQQFALGRVAWRLSPWALLTGKLQASLELNSPYYRADGELVLNQSALNLQIHSGKFRSEVISLQAIQQLLPEPVQLEGELSIGNFQANFDLENQSIQSVNGQVAWNGGHVTFLCKGDTESLTIPPLAGHFETEEATGVITGSAKAEDGQLAGAFTIDQEGWLSLPVTPFVIELVKKTCFKSDIDQGVLPEKLQQRVF